MSTIVLPVVMVVVGLQVMYHMHQAMSDHARDFHATHDDDADTEDKNDEERMNSRAA